MHRPKKILTSKVVHKNPFYQVRKDVLLRKSGRKAVYYTVVIDPFVVICALTPNRKGIYLVKSWRYPLAKYHWELPAGRLDKNETPLMAAKRELKEEAGITAKKWKSLGYFHLAPGISNQKGYIYVAEKIEKIKNARIDREIVEIKPVSLRVFKKMLKERKLLGAPTITASSRLETYLKKK